MGLNAWLKSRPGLNTALGVMFAIVAGLLLLGYLSNLLRGEQGGPSLDIPVAACDIETGRFIDENTISHKPIPKEYVTPGALRRTEQVKGERALRFIGKGEQFTSSSITGQKCSETLSSRIPENLRAYSLQPGVSPGAGPELRPGDRVDVLSTSGDPPRTRTILKNRLVLDSSGTEFEYREGEGQIESPRITLLVSPDEAELLAQAEFEGEISISLCPLESR